MRSSDSDGIGFPASSLVRLPATGLADAATLAAGALVALHRYGAVGGPDVRPLARDGQYPVFPEVHAIEPVGHPLDERAVLPAHPVLPRWPSHPLGRRQQAVQGGGGAGLYRHAGAPVRILSGRRRRWPYPGIQAVRSLHPVLHDYRAVLSLPRHGRCKLVPRIVETMRGLGCRLGRTGT